MKHTTTSGLQLEDLKVGVGPEIQSGNTASMHYTGWLKDGSKFDSSLDRNQPFEFALGTGTVIKGWDEGVAGMKVGGKRTLTIPPHLGYGASGAGGVIPPNATLIFEVELVDFKQFNMNKILIYIATLVLMGCHGKSYQYFNGTFEEAKTTARSKLIFIKFYTNT